MVETTQAANVKTEAKPSAGAEVKAEVKKVVSQVQEATATMRENAREFADQAKAARQRVAGEVQKVMEKNMSRMNEVTAFAKGNVDAVIESAKAAAKGAETLTSHYVEVSKKSAEDWRAGLKTLTAAKTPNEFIQAQNEFAKAQFDRAVANFSEASEAWVRVAKTVVQPLSARVNVAVEAFKKNIAA